MAFQFSSMTMPNPNDDLARKMEDARKIGMQQSIAAAPQQAKPTQVAQAIGVQQAQQQGQIDLASQQRQQQQAAQVGTSMLANEKQAAANSLRERQFKLRQDNESRTNQLAGLDRQLRNELVDSNMQFREDELGRALWNDRQLLDYKLATARSDEDLANYEQQSRQMSDKKMQILRTAHAKIEQAMKQSFSRVEQEKDQAARMELAKYKKMIEDKMRKEQAKAANRAAMFSAAGSIAGAVAGAVIAGPAGAAAGSAIGSGLGSVAASQGA